jgi:phage baseplate assembly protein W
MPNRDDWALIMAVSSSNPDARAFLGNGWGFPIGITTSGELASAAYEEDIRQAIGIILGTSPGERLMRPDFGSGLKALTFEPMSATTMSLARRAVEEALIQWEPRIDSITVTVAPQRAEGRIDITVGYRVRASNTFYNLVYPFCLLEGRAE